MDFIDESKIFVKSGDGGNGCCSFRREKFIPKGGPNGGDGGKGGDIIIRADKSVHTLLDQRYHPHYKAQRGGHGLGKDMSGKSGEDCIIKVPVGTIIKDIAEDTIIADLTEDEQTIVIAKGGDGGRGNARFATSTNQAPRRCEDGWPGQEKTLQLVLKLLADVGLVGFPNAGKSTFISKVSNARPKIADYPFTTLVPNLGLVKWKERDFILADIPGIIEGAHKGTGLGHRFLRHVERTRIIIYILDMSPETGRNPLDELKTLENELGLYSRSLADKGKIVVLNKCDLPEAEIRAKEVLEAIKNKGYACFMASTATKQGLDKVLDAVIRRLNINERDEQEQD
jgi:GTPase